MENSNSQGLSRVIPLPIKREVRKRCGFGCVFCGMFLYEYEHIDPLFSEAHSHDPNNICLLCPNHHARVTKQLISKQEVKEAYSKPKALQKGYSNDYDFTSLKRPCLVHLGCIHFYNPKEMILIQNNPNPILAIADDEDGNLVLNGTFYDDSEKVILQIIENEWRAFSDNWDVEQIGQRLLIKNPQQSLSLSVIVKSRNEVLFDDINMNALGLKFVSKSNHLFSLQHKDGRGFSNLSDLSTYGAILITENGFIITGGARIQ